MRVINHSRILAMDRMKVCRLFLHLAEAVQSPVQQFEQMALITRQMTSSKRGK